MILLRRNERHVRLFTPGYKRFVYQESMKLWEARYEELYHQVPALQTYELYKDQWFRHKGHCIQYWPPADRRSKGILACRTCGATLTVVNVSSESYEHTLLRVPGNSSMVDIDTTILHYFDVECGCSHETLSDSIDKSPTCLMHGINFYTGNRVSRIYKLIRDSSILPGGNTAFSLSEISKMNS